MDWKDTLLDYNEALILSHYSEQLERFAGEDGMKLWWAELLVFLNKQAEITWDKARTEERKRIVAQLEKWQLEGSHLVSREAIEALNSNGSVT